MLLSLMVVICCFMDRRGKIMDGSLRRKMGLAIDDGVFGS